MATAPPTLPLPFFSFAFFFYLLATLKVLPSSAQSCSSYTFPGNRVPYAHCRSLPRLGASLHWTYHPSTATVDVAYRAPQRSAGWVAWGINPTGNGMVGTQALVAFRNSSSGAMVAYTTPVTSYAPSMRPGALAFEVSGLRAERRGGDATIAVFATLRLPNNNTRVHHAWQESSALVGGFPGAHAMTGDNVNSYGSLDFLSGEATTAGRHRNARPLP